MNATPQQVATDNVTTRPVKTLTGRVVSDRMEKTVTVLIERKVKHPLYKKYIRRSHRILAHDAENACRIGDVVTIASCRPLSKHKAWRLQQIVRRPE